MFHFQDPDEGLFFQEIVKQSVRRGKYPEAYALFVAVDTAFCSVTKGIDVSTVPVKEELLQYLAACAKAAFDPGPDGSIDLEVDYIFKRAVRQLMETLRWAILERRNLHTNAEGETLFGSFVIPKHFVALWEKERDSSGDRERHWRENGPSSQLRAV